ncbi:hypothetical protein LBMAG35_16310 [Chlorobiota bacterium]|nr:hypothetical protein LBMAG35_16310 [Chlorobiota bacterium]
MKYKNIREEELKGKVGRDWFAGFDTTRILGDVDFCVSPKVTAKTPKGKDQESLLWAEAKTGVADIYAMFAQLIITIGKARTFDKHLPPAFLGAYDFKKMIFVPYNEVVDIFFMNDFNWNVPPSNHETKEFHIIKDRIEHILNTHTYVFDFLADEKELKHFIKNNIALATESGKILIDKNNFVSIYLRWLTQVKPYINFDWEEGKKQNIVDSDFYLADLFVDDKDTPSMDDDTPIKDELFVVFKHSHYEIAKENLKSLFNATIDITNKEKYEQFWKKYKRQPVADFQQYIIDRRDLLIPQDIRERKGAFFTPQMWVELSQKYIADVLGADWQDEYYVWDCAAGTGNLLAGLTNKYNIWASTLDMADVNVMKERIKNGANLLEDHVFQFDFLNDDFSKLPQELQNIINDPEKRKKLVMYINPPYAEATTAKTVTGTGKNKEGVATDNLMSKKYKSIIGNASNELFALFMSRIFDEINGAILAQFSKMKFIQGSNFAKFKQWFHAKYLKGFVVPANSFDNVKGNFPIGFTIFDTSYNNSVSEIKSDVYDQDSYLIGIKVFYGNLSPSINRWIKSVEYKSLNVVGYIENPSPDFQNNKYLCLINLQGTRHVNYYEINVNTVIYACVYCSVRLSIESTWINDRDQFLYPNEDFLNDHTFINNCFTYTIFNGQNRITSLIINHWIPFTEEEVNARGKFESHFMTDFIKGKIQPEQQDGLFGTEQKKVEPMVFSLEAQAVFDAGRELWRYYHKQPRCNVNASLYDIREYFQGRNDKGKMNNKSDDAVYMELITNLRSSLKVLADKIAPKVYEYGFLKK